MAGRWLQPLGVKKPGLRSWTEAGQGFLEAGLEPETQRHAELEGATPSQKASLEVKWPCGNSSSLSLSPTTFHFTEHFPVLSQAWSPEVIVWDHTASK